MKWVDLCAYGKYLQGYFRVPICEVYIAFIGSSFRSSYRISVNFGLVTLESRAGGQLSSTEAKDCVRMFDTEDAAQ